MEKVFVVINNGRLLKFEAGKGKKSADERWRKLIIVSISLFVSKDDVLCLKCATDAPESFFRMSILHLGIIYQ